MILENFKFHINFSIVSIFIHLYGFKQFSAMFYQVLNLQGSLKVQANQPNLQ